MSKQNKVGTAVLNLPANLSAGLKCGESVELTILEVRYTVSSFLADLQSDFIILFCWWRPSPGNIEIVLNLAGC